MTSRRIAIAAAVLFHLFAVSLDAQVTQSRPQLAKALQEYREKKDLHGEALTLLQLGMADAGLGDIAGARGNLIEAARKLRAENDYLGAWLALMTVSQLELALGRGAEAIPHLEKARATINEAKISIGPFTLKTFAALGSVSGVSPEMLKTMDEPSAKALKPMLLQFMLEPMTHDLFGSALTQTGQLEKAEAELKAAAAASIFSQGMYDFSIESHFGDLRFRQKRYDEARAHYVKALSSSGKMPMPGTADQFIKAGIYDRLARLETITGNPEEAKRWSEKARDMSKKSAAKR